MRPRPALSVLLVTAVLLAIAAQASAHPRTAPTALAVVTDDARDVEARSPTALPAIDTATSAHAGGWLALPALALAAVVAGRRLGRRRLLPLALLAGLAIMGFEAGVHSVHHLGAIDDVECAVASATAHLDGVANVDLVPVALGVAASGLPHAGASVALDRRGSRLDQPRAPPA